MQLGEVAQGAGAEALDDFIGLHLDLGAGALLQLGAEALRQLVHLVHVFRARDDGGRRHHGVLFRLGAHAQLKPRDALFRQLALHQRLLAELVEEPPGHGLLRDGLGHRRGMLPGEQPVQAGARAAHQLVVLRHPAQAGFHRDPGRGADDFVQLHDLGVHDLL